MIWNFTKIAILLVIVSAGTWGCSGDESTPVTPDTKAPTVVSTSPTDGATNVGVDIAISATFSEEMDRWTFGDTTFVVSGGVDGNIVYNSKTVGLTPSEDLDFNTEYTVTLTTDITDAAGNALESDYMWTFTTTKGDIMPLVVGNRWELLKEIIDTTGVLPIDTTLEIIEIARDTIIGSEQWFISTSDELYTNKVDGLWKISGSGQEYLFLKFPAVINDTYFGNPDLVETIRVEAVAILRGVPHGNHLCHLYVSTVSDPTFTYKYYYEPNFGPVAYEKVTTGSGKTAERWGLVRLTLL